MTAPVRVDPADLRSKAARLGVPLPAPPDNPAPPCGLGLAGVAVAQVRAEGEGMRSFIAAGQQDAELLALAMTGAAELYENTDAEGAATIDGTVVAGTQAAMVLPDVPMSVPRMPGAACPAPPGYLDVEAAAEQIAQPDQAATLDSFARNWTEYSAQLIRHAESFELDSVDWQGTAAEVAGDALRRHQTWLQEMAAAAVTTAEHARQLAEVHRRAVAAHPTTAEVQAVAARLRLSTDAATLAQLMADYQKLQTRSEEVLGEYAAGSALTPLDPPSPPIRELLSPDGGDRGKSKRTGDRDGPAGVSGGSVSTTGGTGGAGGAGTPSGARPQSTQPTAPPSTQGGDQSGAGSPSGAGGPSGAAASPTPTGRSGAAPTGADTPGGLPGADLPGSSAPLAGLDDPGVSPAGVGGGSGAGAAGGGGGTAGLPLQPSVGPETVAPAAGGGTRVGSGAIPASAMGTGMGMGGMGGMGHGGAQQGQQKRRDPRFAPDEELYTEDRPYTEPVIGNRRRKDLPDKESK